MTHDMSDEIFVETDFGVVYGRSAGDSRMHLVLGIHGWSKRNGWQTWAPLLEPLSAAGFFVVSVDMPGWGESPAWTSGSMTVDEGVEALRAIISGLGKENATIMGKSWGGGIALEMALKHSQLVSALILSAPAFSRLDRLGGLSQPLLLAWSKDDPVIPFRYSKEWVIAYPSTKLVAYETGGHSAAPNNAEDFSPIAVEFLRSSLPPQSDRS